MKTHQQIFEQVVTHLLTQKIRAISAGGNCVYRAGTSKCAVGCLIPDDIYDPLIEGRTVQDVPVIEGYWSDGGYLGRALNKSGIPRTCRMCTTSILLIAGSKNYVRSP